MRSTRTTLVAVATSTLLALTACGESQTASEEAAEKFMQSMIDRDGEAFCSLIEIEGQPVAENEEALDLCAGQADGAMPEMDDDERTEAEEWLEEGPEKSEEDGDEASVTYGTGDDAFDIDLVRIDGDWFVTLV